MGHWHDRAMGLLRVDRLCGPPVVLLLDGDPLIARCHVARGPLGRLVGLLGTPDLRPDEGLWITRCGGVHAVGLRAEIGVAFLDGHGVVLGVVDPLRRGRFARLDGARAAVECAAGVLAGVAPGRVLATARR